MMSIVRVILVFIIPLSLHANEDLEELSNKVPFLQPTDYKELNLKKQVKTVSATGYYINEVYNLRFMHLLPKVIYTFNEEGKVDYVKRVSATIEEENFIYNKRKLTFYTKEGTSISSSDSKKAFKMEYNDQGQIVKVISSSKGGHFNIDLNSCSRVFYYPSETHIESCFGEAKSIYKMNEQGLVESITTTTLKPRSDHEYNQTLITFEYVDGLLKHSKRESPEAGSLSIKYEHDKNRRVIKTYHSRQSNNPILKSRDKNFLLETEYPEFDKHGNPLKIATFMYALQGESKKLVKETVQVYDYEYYP